MLPFTVFKSRGILLSFYMKSHLKQHSSAEMPLKNIYIYILKNSLFYRVSLRVYDRARQHIKKQRYHFASKGLHSQSYGFSHSHVWMWQSESRSVVSDSLWPHGLYSPWSSPGQNTGVGSLSLLQGIFPTQGSNPGLRIAGGVFTNWAIRGAHGCESWTIKKVESQRIDALELRCGEDSWESLRQQGDPTSQF